jgi:hypothetical protein
MRCSQRDLAVGGEREREHKNSSALAHKIGGFVVHTAAVLDRRRAGACGIPSADGAVRVCGHGATRQTADLHRGGHLLGRELPGMDVLARSRDATRRHQLDIVGAGLHLLPRGLAKPVGAVRLARDEMRVSACHRDELP